MKKVASIFLFAVLLTGTVLADDGHTSGGGKTQPPPCTENCPTSLAKQDATSTTSTDTEAAEPSYFEYFKDVFLDMFV